MGTPFQKSNSYDSSHLNDFMHMGWLYPASPVSKVICPDLVEQADTQDWKTERFVDLAVLRVPRWIRMKLAVRKDALDTITQNFILRMMERRPDLFHDPRQNTLEAYLVGLLRLVERESWRQEAPSRLPDGVTLPESHQQSPFEQLEHDEYFAIATTLLEQLPAPQRNAVEEKYFDGDASRSRGMVPSRIIHVRRSRGLSTMRTAAEQLGIVTHSRLGQRRRMCRGGRRPRGRAIVRKGTSRTKFETDPATSTGTEASVAISEREKAIRASNARALQRLLSSIPAPLSESGEVLARAIEIFEKRFARRLTRSRGG